MDRPHKTLLVEKSDGVCTLTLNRPEALNAFDATMRDELISFVEAQRDDREVRVLVITGAGERAFSAGGDVRRMGQRDVPAQREHVARVGRLITAMATLEKPIVAAVNGIAAGAGASLAIACDLVVAAERARFSFAYVRMAVTPTMGTLYFLPRLVGPARARRLLMTGETVAAREAERLGLISEVVPDDRLAERASEIARGLASGPAKAIGLTKLLANRALDLDLAGALELEGHASAVCWATKDHEEAVAAFLEKRAPRFGK